MMGKIWIYLLGLLLSSCSCGIYSFQDSSIPPDIKSIKVGVFENKASIVNVILANEITNSFKNKIQQQTKLTLLNSGTGDYEIQGYISRYDVSTSGISGSQATHNQLNLTIHLQFTNNAEDRYPDIQSFETDISLFKQFSAQLSLQQAEQSLLNDLVKEAVNLMFSRIFSNW